MKGYLCLLLFSAYFILPTYWCYVVSRERLKILGFYVLAALIIARVVIAPLQHSLSDKKALLHEYEDTYNMRRLSVEKFKAQEESKNKEGTAAAVEEGFLKSFYGSDVPYTTLQADVVEKITDLAGKEGLTVSSFEFSEPTSLKNISEAPVVMRLNGEQRGVVVLLRELEKSDKKLVVRRLDITKSGPYASQCSLTVSAFRLEK